MPRSGDDAKRRIIAAAERLFASHGIEGVALSQVNDAAHQRSNTAVNHHFVDRQSV